MNKLRILIIGCVKFSYELTKKILENNRVEIVGICTKKKSDFNSDFVDLAIIAKKKRIPYIYSNNINTEHNKLWIKHKKPDYILCIGWPNLLSEKIFKIPKFFTIGYHPADLPNNRGRNPLIWTIILDLKQSASTFFKINKQPDAGEILLKKKFRISKNENASTLYKKVINISISQIDNLILKLYKTRKKKILIKKKDKKILGNVLRKRVYKDGVIDWRMDAYSILRLVRALNYPYPGASFYFKNKEYKVISAKIVKSCPVVEPGKVIEKSKQFTIIKCGKYAIKILKLNQKIYCKKGDYIL